MEEQNNFKAENLNENNNKEGEMVKKNRGRLLFLQILRWLLLALAILFFLWLAKNLGWLRI